MNYGKIDKLIGKHMRSNFGKSSERRDYFKMEREDKRGGFKGYGEKNGIMYLADVMNSYYIDVNIMPKVEEKDATEGTVKMVFRADDDDLIRIYFNFKDTNEINVKYFMELVWEYLQMEKRWHSKVHEFSNGILSPEFLRNNQIENILK
jgi:hypothetical protein